MAPLVYLITGANKGIGYEATRILAERFRDEAIILLGTRTLKNGEDAIAKMKQANPSFDFANVELVEIDVSKNDSIQAATDYVKAKYGNVHVLVNNAGIAGRSEGAEMCFQVNVFGVWSTLEAFNPLLVPNQSINIVVASGVGSGTFAAMSPTLQAILDDVNKLDTATVHSLVDDWLASAHGKPSEHSWPNASQTYGPYGVSKTLVMSVSRKWAADHPDIKTVVVCPGFCATDLNNHTGKLSAAQGGEHILFPVFHPDKTESGKFYSQSREHAFNSF
ncbi:unnamed protein product [Aphanomyces euteiches]|uniref:NAD(P)-binding protein n=1 Tax=Aphanomyces euteiches TaxID=100861 RepID=A0A6G0W6W8_9STRA|nr:hypothetical protein Ae201684_018610 [Aphanomyces euteiches]KAH9137405.1 hypothetical protein AeRB84_017867 [Aphanomyces euteiches]